LAGLVFRIHSLYGKGLARTCLPIGEESTVITLQTRVDDWLSYLFEHCHLGDVFTGNEVKGELVFRVQDQFFVFIYFSDASLYLCALVTHQLVASISDLIVLGQRSDPDDNLYILSLWGWTSILIHLVNFFRD
jgi:hypothetical protein